MKIDRFKLFANGKELAVVPGSVELRMCDHDYQLAHDLFVSGKIDRYRCTKCGDVLPK